MIETNVREWIRRERLESESDKNAEKWITNGPDLSLVSRRSSYGNSNPIGT